MTDRIRVALVCACGNRDEEDYPARPCSGGCGRWMQAAPQAATPIELAPLSDDDLVLKFRAIAAALVDAMPDATVRERRSRVVTMLFRAGIEELVAHLGRAGMKDLAYARIFAIECERAMQALEDEAARPKQ